MATSRPIAASPCDSFPCRLDNVAKIYASSVSTSLSAYEDLLGNHLYSVLDLVASSPVSEYLDSSKSPGPEPRTYTAQPRCLEDERHPWDLYYFYFSRPNPNSTNDCYDPTRECFHIDGTFATDSDPEAAEVERVDRTPPPGAHPPTQEGALPHGDDDAQVTQMA